MVNTMKTFILMAALTALFKYAGHDLIQLNVSFQKLLKYHWMMKSIHHQYDRARQIAL
jgi:hypothetical protein